jgi:hypothetical protein
VNLRRLCIIGLVLACSVTTSGLALIAASDAYATGFPVYYDASDSSYDIFSSSVPPATASTTLKVPAVTGCTKTNRQVGFGPGVEDSSGAGADPFVVVGCKGGKAIYSANFYMFGTITASSVTVHPGNSLSLSVSMTATTTTITFDDTTTGSSQTETGAADTAAYGFVGSFPVQKGATLLGVPDFARVTFKNVLINGSGIGTYTSATGLYEFIRTTNGSAPPSGTVQIQPGALGTSSFSLTYKHS